MLVNLKYEARLIESHKRSIVKSITYRFMGIIITITIAFLFTRKVFLSISIGLFDTLIKLFGYYLHERIWNKIKFGKEKIEYHI